MPIYRFDRYLLDTALRQLKRDGEPVLTTPKILETLIVLVQTRGRVIEKDELLQLLWPDTAVEEANLTQNVSMLRRLLGDDVKSHRYIATIPGRGYAFVAPVTEVVTEEAKPLQRPERRLWAGLANGRVVYIGIAGCVLLAIAAWYIARADRTELPDPAVFRFTSFPGVETMPAFSPDGKQLAYVRSERAPFGRHFSGRHSGQANIYTKLIGAGTELRVTSHAGADYYPAWSPDGQYIAFYRDEPGASGCYVVSALGGPERQITNYEGEVAGLAWLPDGRHLAISHVFEGSHGAPLVEISVDTGKQRPLTSPPVESLGDASPAVSPDGKTLAFLRARNPRAVEACFMRFSNRKIRCRPIEGSWTEGLAWAAPGNGIVVSAARNAGHRLWRYRLNGGPPQAITSGEEEAELPAVSRQGNELAYVLSSRNVNLWELDLDASAAMKPEAAKPIVTSSRFQSDPAFSPDGRKLAFLSDRSGSREIWISDGEGQNSSQLTHFRGPPAGSPSWSPDGREIAFDLERGPNSDIFVISAAGGVARRITAAPGENVLPSWSRDGKFIYFASSRSGKFQVWKTPAATGETPERPAARMTRSGGFRPIESADGKFLYYAKGRGERGLWKQSLGSSTAGEEKPVLESLQEWGWWALSPNLLYFLERQDFGSPQVHLKALDLATGKIRELSRLSAPVLAWSPVMSVSDDGRHLVYTQIDSLEADVMLMENFR